jgi:hypothetical protein
LPEAPPVPSELPVRAGPASQPPDLLVEHLEVRLVAPAPSEPDRAGQPPAAAGSRRAWDVAVRHYLGRL